jgi:8-oxo-dGTP pyrophosphatase MutT (NUDIX family)
MPAEWIGPYERLSTREVYRNPWIRVRADDVIRPGGIRGEFAVLEMRGGSSTLAVDDGDYAYLVEEYKYGIERLTIEAPSGGFDHGETPLETAQRELREEAGIEAGEWLPLGSIHPFTTAVKSPVFLFLARKLSMCPQNLDPGEVVQVVRMPFAELVDRVMSGEIDHGPTCVLALKAARVLGV